MTWKKWEMNFLTNFLSIIVCYSLLWKSQQGKSCEIAVFIVTPYNTSATKKRTKINLKMPHFRYGVLQAGKGYKLAYIKITTIAIIIEE